MWIFFSVIANIAIMYLEWSYRNGFTFFSIPVLLAILTGQYGLYNSYKLAPSLLLAGAVFTLINLCLRMINTSILGEYVGIWQYVGVFFMILATLAFKMK